MNEQDNKLQCYFNMCVYIYVIHLAVEIIVNNSNLFISRLDFKQNPPLMPTSRITPRRNLGVVQQRAMPIPLPTQVSTPQQSADLPQQNPSGIAAPQVQQQPMPTSSVQQMGQAMGGEVYTMANLHNLAVTQGRRLIFCRRWGDMQSHPQCH